MGKITSYCARSFLLLCVKKCWNETGWIQSWRLIHFAQQRECAFRCRFQHSNDSPWFSSINHNSYSQSTERLHIFYFHSQEPFFDFDFDPFSFWLQMSYLNVAVVRGLRREWKKHVFVAFILTTFVLFAFTNTVLHTNVTTSTCLPFPRSLSSFTLTSLSFLLRISQVF